MQEFKSHRKYYWFSLFTLIFLILLFNIFFVKTKKNFYFEFYFLIVILVWIGTLTLNGIETNRIKVYLEKYLSEKYPNKLKEFKEKPIDLLNSESEQILDLLNDNELLKDENILILKNESNDITKFMYAIFFTLPSMLFIIFFLILK
ncbi:MAG: hypothetical protein KatS3mg068_1733 [Candidatus Sericytochromatia bacterium]|nr:MAG: hypothetical protein KatS3mg068_1733 [Candidatus Sericytochromatia bacterium]